jgi:hypothetical protein
VLNHALPAAIKIPQSAVADKQKSACQGFINSATLAMVPKPLHM